MYMCVNYSCIGGDAEVCHAVCLGRGRGEGGFYQRSSEEGEGGFGRSVREIHRSQSWDDRYSQLFYFILL